MMNKIRYFLLILAIPLLFSNCQKKEVEVEPKEALEFKLRLLNENLEETTEFKEGENIIFSFYIKNNTSKTVWYEGEEIQGASADDFFKVYHVPKTGLDEDYGKAYDSFEGGFLQYPSTLSGKTTLEFRVPWISSDNPKYYMGLRSVKENHITPLPKGNYYTQDKIIWEYGNLEEFRDENRESTKIEKKFKIEFTVK